ncbi:hypothetical protein [uncultured Nocardioides sp.]|uniref:hypothetical protein n=1 Tax=uncultured Nocardioides sp. TaxID=198441 RepID=UPI000C484040|nr:hypothetical protein [Nocardioides sp.]|tara:strand:+ start:176 stop:1165 length:990 start_codon:yes stop_codon:yes gene_type:complete
MSGQDVLDAFTRIRCAAETHMDHRDRERLGWSEETVTEACTNQGLPQVKVIPFNRNQEGRAIGADYLWWFLDQRSSACFGMLVQAKRISRGADRWKVDIRHRQGRQLADLLATARQLEVPAMYGIYTGGLVLRADMPCFHDQAPGCVGCRRMAISMISAYQLADVWGSPTTTADLVLTDGIPLENLVDPDLVTGTVADVNLSEIRPGQLRDFLLLDQDGPLEVAKRIFRAVCEHRARGFSAATAEPLTIPGAPLFPEVPNDTGHFPGPYYRHFLQGLRASPPSYVRQLQGEARRDDTMGYVTAVSAPRGPRRPRALRGVDVDGVVLATM